MDLRLPVAFAHVSIRRWPHPVPQLAGGTDSLLWRHGNLLVNIPLSRLVERTCLVNNSLHRSILVGVGPCIKLLWIQVIGIGGIQAAGLSLVPALPGRTTRSVSSTHLNNNQEALDQLYKCIPGTEQPTMDANLQSAPGRAGRPHHNCVLIYEPAHSSC